MFSCSIVHRLYPDHEGSLSLSHSRKRAQSLASLLQLCALVRVRRGAISTPLTPPPPRPGGARRSATTSSTARADASGAASTRARSTRVADDGGATSPRRCFYLLCRMLVFCYFLVRTLVFCTFVLQPLGHHYTLLHRILQTFSWCLRFFLHLSFWRVVLLREYSGRVFSLVAPGDILALFGHIVLHF